MSNNLLVRQILKAGGSFFVGASIAIGTLCPIVLTSSRALALADFIDSTDIPNDAINELQNLDNQSIIPNAIAFTPDGGYAILYDKNSYYTNNLPQDALEALATLYNQGSTINTIAFTPAGEWVIIFDGNGYYPSANFPQDALNELTTLNQQGITINNIAFTPDGEWVIIGNNGFNAYWSSNLPQDVINQLNSILKKSPTQSFTIQSVAFAPNGGWIIIYNGGSNTTSYNIPPQLADTINRELQLSNHPLIVAFTPNNGWVLEYGLIQYVLAY